MFCFFFLCSQKPETRRNVFNWMSLIHKLCNDFTRFISISHRHAVILSFLSNQKIIKRCKRFYILSINTPYIRYLRQSTTTTTVNEIRLSVNTKYAVCCFKRSPYIHRTRHWTMLCYSVIKWDFFFSSLLFLILRFDSQMWKWVFGPCIYALCS